MNKKDEFDIIDVSDKQKDVFIKKIYISLIVLVVLGLITYFFGYNIFKPFIRV